MKITELTLRQMQGLEYVGGGYFRMPGPRGKKMPIYHAPELVQALIQALGQAQKSEIRS